LKAIDQRLAQNAEQKRGLIQNEEGKRLFETALELTKNYPWLMETSAKWNATQLNEFYVQAKGLAMEADDPINWVTDFPTPPSDDLISLAASKAGHILAYLKNATKQMIQRQQTALEQLAQIHIKGVPPQSKSDWNLVFKAMERERAIHSFREAVLKPMVTREDWPEDAILDVRDDGRARIKPDILSILHSAFFVKAFAFSPDMSLT